MHTGRYPHIADEELVVYALVGNLPAFDELTRRYRRAVLLVAQSETGSFGLAEDITQETFLLAFKALPQLQEPAKFPGWLCAIARRQARRMAGREARQLPATPSQLDTLLRTHCRELIGCPETEAERSQTQHDVQTALALLPDRDALIARLYYLEALPVARIADFLSLPVTTVKWRLHQTRLRLRRHFLALHEREERCEANQRSERRPPG